MGSVTVTSKKQIRAYFVSKCDFVNPNPSLEEMRDICTCSDKTFLEKVTENTLAIYQSVVDAVLQRSGTHPIPPELLSFTTFTLHLSLPH
jgi:glutamate dehydrogenase